MNIPCVPFSKILPVLWGILVVIVFFLFLHFHPLYQWDFIVLQGLEENIFSTLWMVLFLLLGAGSFSFFLSRFSPIKIFFFFWGELTFGALFLGWWADILTDISLFEYFFRFAGTYGLFLLAIFIFLFLLIGIGSKVLKNEKSSLFQEGVVGFASLGFIGFFLAEFGLFHPLLWGPALLFFLLWDWSFFQKKFSQFCQTSCAFSRSEKVFLSIVLTITSLNIFQTFFPFSVGWDSLNHYFVTIRELAENGVLRSGIFPPFTEIVLAFPTQILGLSAVPFFLVLTGGILWGLMLGAGKKLQIPQEVNGLLATTFFLLPAVQFQLSRDPKMDIVFLIFLFGSFSFFREKRWDWAALLLGISSLLKLTSLWFFPFFLFLFIRDVSFKKYRLLLRIIGLLFLPLLLWGGMNFMRTSDIPQNISAQKEIFFRGPDYSPQLKTEHTEFSSTGFQEEVTRYSGYSANPLVRLWSAFTDQNVPPHYRQYVDNGFWWFVLLPVVFGFLLYFWKKKDSDDFWLVILGGCFFLCWVWWGHVIAWYGWPWMILLLFLAGRILTRDVSWKRTLIFLFMISLGLGLFSRLEHTFRAPLMASLSWAAFPNQENANRLSDEFFREEKEVARLLHQDPKAKIYRIGTMTNFWIQNADRRIFDDPQLDRFAMLAEEDNDFSSLKKQLQDQNFQYILVDRATASIEREESGTLHQKFSNFQIFADQFLRPLFWGDRLILFEIPRN
ncbi:hypothetical protein K9M59_03355 [Candidatus Gracilibacteria bacterium]|nr:hypothetical protein [Candidatus Gracilibacteria bacterium]MCF7819365.1 hypothetical protein [Candidatus Gracilibacteria bacterium]